MITATKKHVLDVMKDADIVTIELQYDPSAFAVYDFGEELRRISLLSFGVVTQGETTESYHVRYIGQAILDGTILAIYLILCIFGCFIIHHN